MRKGYVLLALPAVFLLGFVAAALTGGDTGAGIRVESAERPPLSVADATPAWQPAAESTATPVTSNADCTTEVPPNSPGTMDTVSEPSAAAPLTHPGTGSSDLGSGGTGSDSPAMKPPGHPTAPAVSKCPRSSDSDSEPH